MAKKTGKQNNVAWLTADEVDFNRRPRCLPLASGPLSLLDPLIKTFEEMAAAAFAGDNPCFNELLSLAGYQGNCFDSALCAAEMLGHSLSCMKDLAQKYPKGAPKSLLEPRHDEPDPTWIDFPILALCMDARDGFCPPLNTIITSAGYRNYVFAASQEELASHFGVDVRTIRRWVVDGMPVVHDGRGQGYNIQACDLWKNGCRPGEYMPQGCQVEAWVEKVSAKQDTGRESV